MQVFARLRENKLQAKLKKCGFGKPHVKYLGHVVGSGELHVDMDKVAAVREWSAPVDIKGFSSFWVLPITTTGSYPTLQRLLHLLATCCLVSMNLCGGRNSRLHLRH